MLENAHWVVVTGGDKGIGKGVVDVLAQAGYYVLFTYLSNIAGAKALTSKYSNVSSIRCDLLDNESVQSAIENINDKTSRIDILVNNAGIDKDSLFIKMDFLRWSEVINTNLVQLYHFTHSFLPLMITNNWGRIINVSSIGAFQDAYGKSNYAAAKAGILGFTRALALEVADKGVTVNAICPGAFDTSMFERIPEKYREGIKSMIPMKRLGNPEEIGHLVEFLVSERASYITGQTIHINGGWYLG